MPSPEQLARLKSYCERIHRRYHHRRFVHPDPLELLYEYPSVADREVAGLVASCMAYGRVEAILKAVAAVLKELGGSPRTFLLKTTRRRLERIFVDFKYRFTDGGNVSSLLWGIAGVLKRHGSIERCFLEGYREGREAGGRPVLAGMRMMVDSIRAASEGEIGMLLPSPAKGSACKRLNLYLRWMVRADDVDPGGWTSVRPSELIVPLDTHMYSFALEWGLTGRKSADLKAALEITDVFRLIVPDDPVRYDFSLTRPGIRDERYS